MELKSLLRGEVIEPGTPGYEDARKVHNGMIDRHPRLIARCADVADVITTIRFAREQNLLVSIRGGGHNAAGLGVCDDGLVIDLSGLRYTQVDAQARTVRVGGGCTWGEVDHATHAFGLAVPSGIISTTGVGGLTLGGGLGSSDAQIRPHDRQSDLGGHGAGGRERRYSASKVEHQDLFWAIRGGGGNFGVVTSFLFQAHPVHTDYAGPMLWELAQAPEMMRWYRDFIAERPTI